MKKIKSSKKKLQNKVMKNMKWYLFQIKIKIKLNKQNNKLINN